MMTIVNRWGATGANHLGNDNPIINTDEREQRRRIAHELNNPLDGIQRYIRLALQLSREGKAGEIAWYLEEAGTGLARMAEMIREIADQPASLDTEHDQPTIREVIDEARRVHALRAKAADVRILLNFDSNAPAPPGSELYRIASNLIINAIEAMGDGGELIITGRREADQCIIQFTDTGPGLPDAVEWAFVPHNTSKGHHQGLGLTICRDCAMRLGGAISAENRAQGGACFTLRLPLHAAHTEVR